ncbi:MAG: sigma-54-dependent Fis family transcriptional regulator [Myxococcota bacterium]|nr:sigma-54-dependent Fis family transcriptional regulator [Myxococcota bacterium]
MSVSSELRCVRERDLYLELLRLLGGKGGPPKLSAVLAAMSQLADAPRVYLELFRDAGARERSLSRAHGCTDQETQEIQSFTSRGIVAATIGSGQTLHTPMAFLDARFRESESVQGQRLEAVLCIPLPGKTPGVLYLEGRAGAGPFSPEVILTLETAAQVLGPLVESLAEDPSSVGADPTAPLRARLQITGLAGRSAALAHVFEQVVVAAPTDVGMLITGPSGTGKTQLARVIHANSRRRAGPFLELNCAAIPEGLFESELFGTMPGAFPGARRTEGKVELAEGGTLFLDEIAEIPLTAQGKLLQLLQSRQYFALAGTKQATANVRVIAATNADLEERVSARAFREDLFYRLNVFTVRMPSLSERREDIGPILEELLRTLAAEHELPRLLPSPLLRRSCEAQDWPGNIRQLRNQLEGGLIRASAEGASQVEPRHLLGAKPSPERGPLSFHDATLVFQRDLLRRELLEADWNVSEVARRLDVTRSHVYNLIKTFGLQRAVPT